MANIVLVGGRAIRLGRLKSSEDLCGRTLLQRVLDHLSILGGDILIVTSKEQPEICIPEGYGTRLLVDYFGGKGPLGGIYTGLKESNDTYNIVVACDMPFLNISLLKYMSDICNGYDATTPVIEGYLEPLHSIYSVECLTKLERYFNEKKLSVHGFLPGLQVRQVTSEEIDKFDPEHLSFFNINSPEDLQKAREIVTVRGEDILCYR